MGLGYQHKVVLFRKSGMQVSQRLKKDSASSTEHLTVL